MSNRITEALVLTEHARDALHAAAKLVERDGDAFKALFKSSLSLVDAIREIKKEREDKVTDALIALSMKGEGQ